jgi:hypothetical protein
MGFLKHAANDIVLDAVLTDAGRELLSRNDGSFSIVKFALSDEEVDYAIISQFGRNVGKEKIEKNTPVFEALTTGNLAQKNRLASISNKTLTHYPNISFSNSDTTSFALGLSGTTTISTQLTQSINSTYTVPDELVNHVYRISVDNMFLEVTDDTPESISSNNIATYLLVKDSALDTTSGGSILSLNMKLKSTLSATMFNYYGTGTSISTYVKVQGLQDGVEFQFEVTISS